MELKQKKNDKFFNTGLFITGFFICIGTSLFVYYDDGNKFVAPLIVFSAGVVFIWFGTKKILLKLLLPAISIFLILVAYNFSFFAQFWFTSTETTYYPNGQKRFERHNKCGIHDGIWEAWNEKGQLTLHRNYIMGKKNGEFSDFNDSTGLIQLKQYYNMDQLDSEILYHHGIKATTCYYKIIAADTKENTYLLWRDNGTINSKMIDKYKEENLSNNRILNIQSYYDSLGKIISSHEKYHINKTLDSVINTEYDKTGNKTSVTIEKIFYKNGEIVFKKTIN